MQNFDSPYKSASITEFWRRWHISLSTWLRDYLYIPLGGNRKGPRRTLVNLMTVMLLGGLWHGASWNFVVWGGIHGSMLALERRLGAAHPSSRWPRALSVAATFLVVCVSWVFFRAKTLGQALVYLGSMFGLAATTPASDVVAGALYTPYHGALFVVCGALVWGMPNTWQLTERLSAPRALWAAATLAAATLVMWTQTTNPFLYFQF
jgi:alginate O-acetyltransferase complex protein AlgI